MSVLVCGDRRVYLEQRILESPDGRFTLTPREAELLAYLAEQDRVVSSDELLREVWRYHPHSQSRAVRYTILRLRRKLEPDPKQPSFLLTEYGAGYRLRFTQESPSSEDGTDKPEHNLLPARTAFYGRIADREALQNLLADGRRLISVLGPPGIGKTRLMLELGWTELGRWPGGIWLIQLAQTRTVKGIQAALASVLGVSTGAEDNPQILRALRARGRALFLLDNFEQIVDCATELSLIHISEPTRPS